MLWLVFLVSIVIIMIRRWHHEQFFHAKESTRFHKFDVKDNELVLVGSYSDMMTSFRARSIWNHVGIMLPSERVLFYKHQYEKEIRNCKMIGSLYDFLHDAARGSWFVVIRIYRPHYEKSDETCARGNTKEWIDHNKTANYYRLVSERYLSASDIERAL